MHELFDALDDELDDELVLPDLALSASGGAGWLPLVAVFACLGLLALLIGAGIALLWHHPGRRPPLKQALARSIYGTPQPLKQGPLSQAEAIEVGYGTAPPRIIPRYRPLEIAPPAVLESESAAEIAGALPAGFRYSYNAPSYHGWPVKPLHATHTIRGGFLDPRDLAGGYHFGVDISVDDLRKEPGAPYGTTHRVYAVDSGYVAVSSDGIGLNGPCDHRHFALGHFEYWHIRMTVKLGQWVQAGQPIGWTCFGDGHIHLSEWQLVNGARAWVNPLHTGGKLSPYVDRAAPMIGSFSFYAPAQAVWCPRRSLAEADGTSRLLRSALSGEVELRVPVADRSSLPKHGFLTPRLQGVTSPYRVAVTVRSAADRSLVVAANSFEADRLPQTPYLVHYAPGTRSNLPLFACIRRPQAGCAGSYLLRPFSGMAQRYWDTRQVANGGYLVTVYAWDVSGHMAQRTERVEVANPAGEAALGASPIADASVPACWQNGFYRAWQASSGTS